MTSVWYCTREDVKTALDAKETARTNVQIGRQIDASSRLIEGKLHRKFYPQTDIRYKDWPNGQGAYPWRVWLGPDELISLSSLTAGGVSVPLADVNLEPADLGPPYDRLELILSTSAVFSAGSTYQRAIAIGGTFGYSAQTLPGGALAAAISSTTVTTATVTDSASVGVGSLIKIDGEYLNVTGKASADTGQTLAGDITALASGTAVGVQNGAAIVIGENILIGTERMSVEDIAGNTLVVKRAYDGSVLAAHTAGATIYAPRLLTVERGAVGSTASAHSNGATVSVHYVPAGIRSLSVAETLANLLGDASSWAVPIKRGQRTSPGDPFTTDLERLWDSARATYGRVRGGAVV